MTWKFWAGALLVFALAWPAQAARGRVVDAEFRSRALEGNLVGVDTLRRIKVYLPPGYERGASRYPVVYYVHNTQWSPRQLFEENRLNEFLDRAIARGRLGKYWMPCWHSSRSKLESGSGIASTLPSPAASMSAV